jgi:uncharacterized protein Yka (UPF0111/DUF47 family)
VALGQFRGRISRALTPAEHDFFELVEHAGRNALQAADSLDELVHYFPRHREVAGEIGLLRTEADRIDDELAGRVGGTYVTPLDRDQLRDLSRALRDVVGRMEAVADLLSRYRIDGMRPQARRLSHELLVGVHAAAEATGKLREIDDLRPQIAQVRGSRRAGLMTVREGLGELFAENPEPIELVRWKDLFERFEMALDACGRIAVVLDAIRVGR